MNRPQAAKSQPTFGIARQEHARPAPTQGALTCQPTLAGAIQEVRARSRIVVAMLLSFNLIHNPFSGLWRDLPGFSMLMYYMMGMLCLLQTLAAAIAWLALPPSAPSTSVSWPSAAGAGRASSPSPMVHRPSSL